VLGLEFVYQHMTVVMDDFAGHAAVVELVAQAAAATRVKQVVDDQAFVISIFVALPIDAAAAWSDLAIEAAARRWHGPVLG
jgi:hypothetical protein